MSVRHYSLALLLSASVIIGCKRDATQGNAWRDTVHEARVRPASPSSKFDAVESMAAARCLREERCNGFAPGTVYSSRIQCLTAERVSFTSAMGKCGGIAPEPLAECLGALRNRSCTASMSVTALVFACEAERLCPTSR